MRAPPEFHAMHRRHLLAAATAATASAPPRTVSGAAGTRRVVAELFTSQSCSSCPPADALLEELAGRRPDVLALSYHVTYWNRLGWRDRFSLPEATERQRRYAATLGHGQVYTPQLVVQGRRDVVGSDRGAVLGAIASAAADPGQAVAMAVAPSGAAVVVEAGAGSGAGTVVLLGYDRRQVTPVGGGENRGRTLAHANVVRGLAAIGEWRGRPMRAGGARPEGEHVAVLLQAADGAILGAASA